MLEARLEELWARSRPAIMGIVNVTPDSFSDGGCFATDESAVAHAATLIAEGADVIDIGGESTRPGAEAVGKETEQARVVPVISAVARRFPRALISVDTTKADVAAAALDAGALIVNDVSAGGDAAMLPLVAARGAAIVLMHMRGTPRTMQNDTTYSEVIAEVHTYLRGRAGAAIAAGIPGERIFLDPGIGFGKDVEGNLALLRALPDLAALGHPVVVGASRKSFIGALTGAGVRERLAGSLASLASIAAVRRAVARVHDVAPTRQFLSVVCALAGGA